MTKYWVLFALVGCGVDSTDSASPATHPKAPDTLLQAFADAQEHSFIVSLPAPSTERARVEQRDARVARIAALTDISVEYDWDQLPLVQVRASSADAALAALDSDDVEQAFEITHYELTDAESFPLVGQPAAAAGGNVGAGTAVAVLDTGANYKLGDFGSCTAPNTPASTCRVVYAQDFAANDNSLDDNGHGTNVSGIIAGIAPGTKIIALDVFAGGSASSTDILSALNWVVTNRVTYNIASLNLSLGGGSSTSICTGDAVGNALATARSSGIAPVVASGNGGLTNAMSWPACAQAAISVGAVYDANVGGLQYGNCADATTAADKITCFSNSASFLSLLAPGALISAAGYTMAGTSQATPHVAGAFAVLHAAFPAYTVDQELARLTESGKRITDPRNNVTTARIDLGAAVAGVVTDVTSPTGTVSLATGTTYTKTTAVTLAIAASDASGVSQMCVTNTTTCSTFEAFSTQKAWTLPAGDGEKTVTVFLRDSKGNTTSSTTSPKLTVRIDATAPTNGTATASTTDGSVSLAWKGFTDAGSGIASYRVAAATSATAPSSCATAVYTGSGLAFTHTGLTAGTTYSYRICAVDNAGNSSTGVAISATPHETTPPVGALKINAGATVAKSKAVTLTLSATDASPVTQMCISEGSTCSTWVTYATTLAYTFAGDGSRTLHAWFRDKWGNVSEPASATILVDITAPTNPTLTTTVTSSSIAISWTAATDAGSGVASYKLVGAAGTTAPASCSAGTTLYSGADLAYTQTVAAKTTWSYRLCATDVAGNTSAGVTKSATSSAN